MPEPTLTLQQFAEWVHDALNRLYDSPYLQNHPLADLLLDENGSALRRSQALRYTLLDAIRATRPKENVPARSPDWRTYRVLELRYIEGLRPTEAMEQLALGKSQYFREQARALEAVTAILWARRPKDAQPTRQDLAKSAAERLSAHATWEPIEIAPLLDDLRSLIEPLASGKGIPARLHLAQQLVVPRADRIVLRQTVLSVVTYMLDAAEGTSLDVGSFQSEKSRGIRIRLYGAAERAQRPHVRLDISRQLMTAMGGSLHIEPRRGDCWEARLSWPVSGSPVLLVVDDNEGILALFRRYLGGHNWRVLGATSGAQARKMIAQTLPTVVVLDVMMPDEDGWEFLTALQTREDTRDIPIIVCSVLNESQLAFTLGAAAYLTKPVTQQALLQALAPWSRPDPTPATGH